MIYTQCCRHTLALQKILQFDAQLYLGVVVGEYGCFYDVPLQCALPGKRANGSEESARHHDCISSHSTYFTRSHSNTLPVTQKPVHWFVFVWWCPSAVSSHTLSLSNLLFLVAVLLISSRHSKCLMDIRPGCALMIIVVSWWSGSCWNNSLNITILFYTTNITEWWICELWEDVNTEWMSSSHIAGKHKKGFN